MFRSVDANAKDSLTENSKAKVSTPDIPRLIDLLNSQNFHYLEKERSSPHKPPLQERASRVKAWWPARKKANKNLEKTSETKPDNSPANSPQPQTPGQKFTLVQPPLDPSSVAAPEVTEMDRKFLALTTTQRLALIAVEAVIDIFEGKILDLGFVNPTTHGTWYKHRRKG